MLLTRVLVLCTVLALIRYLYGLCVEKPYVVMRSRRRWRFWSEDFEDSFQANVCPPAVAITQLFGIDKLGLHALISCCATLCVLYLLRHQIAGVLFELGFDGACTWFSSDFQPRQDTDYSDLPDLADVDDLDAEQCEAAALPPVCSVPRPPPPTPPDWLVFHPCYGVVYKDWI